MPKKLKKNPTQIMLPLQDRVPDTRAVLYNSVSLKPYLRINKVINWFLTLQSQKLNFQFNKSS